MDAYRFAQEELSPHVFGIAAAAYKGLVEDYHSQAIIISGESGAGKTEATKKCLQFFAQVAAGGEAGMDQKLLAANPILEAFGNAKTVRNNNSSRFGKWMEVQFSRSGGIIGCRIVNYLLEKSRIVHPAGEERSYHIFYNLFVGLDRTKKAALHLTNPEEFEYLRHASTTISGSSQRDVEDFSDVLDAFSEVGISEEEQSTLFRLTASVLHLGNVVFEVHDTPQGSEGSTMKPSTHLDAAAELLGVSKDSLSLELTSRVRVAGGDTMRSPLVPAKAADARDALAKAIYGRMFDWLVLRVNQAMHTTETVGGIIGVLDIFGFEIFETNVFEQLCINFCNEMLQQHFNTHVFKVEEQLYIDEGIDYSNVEFIDNQDVLDLIQKRPAGILPMLDDEVKLPRGSDGNFLARINKAHAGHSRFLALKAGASGNKTVDGELGKDAGRCGDLPFAVKHYAGGVVYECTGWLSKNKDEIMPNHAQLMVSSSDTFLSEVLFGGQDGMPAYDNSTSTPNAGAASSAGAGKGKSKTQAGKFRAQLSALRETLNANKPHYIRCIKPNSVKKPAVWHGQLCLQQLRYSGIFEAVRIRQQGFPFRFTFKEFYGKYASVVDISAEELSALGPTAKATGKAFPGTATNNRRTYRPVPQERHRSSPWRSNSSSAAPRSDAFYRSMCAAVMQKMAALPDPAVAGAFQGLAVQTGHSMQFYQAAAHHQLTKRRTIVRQSAAVDLQTVFRRWSARLRVQRGLAALAQVRAVCSIRTLEALDEAVSSWDATREACRLPDLAEVASVRALRDRLQAEADCRAECQELLALDPTKEYQRFLRVVKQAEEFELSGGAVDAAKAKFESVRAYYQAKEDLQQGCAQHDKRKIEAAQGAAVALRAMWGDVFDPAEVQAAEAALAAIGAEEERLRPLVAAMGTGGITQAAAADFSSCAVGPALGGVAWAAVSSSARSLLGVSGSHVQDHLSLLRAGDALRTPTGRALACAADSIVAARSAIQEAVRSAGSGDSVDRALSALTALQQAVPPSELSEMPDELRREVQAAHATHLNLKHCRALAAAVAAGAPSGACGELDMSRVDSKTMLQRSAEAHAAFDAAAQDSSHAPAMCSALTRLVKTASALCPLRSAMAKHDWATVRGLLATIDGIDSTVPCAQKEVHVAFDEIENLDLLAACSAAFATPAVSGRPGSVDVGAADDAVARADAALSSGTEPKSRAAQAQLAFISAALRPLRRAAGERDWPEVRRLLRPLVEAARRGSSSGAPVQAAALDSALRQAMQGPLVLGGAGGAAAPVAVPPECRAELALACAQSLHAGTVAALASGVAQGRLVGLPGSIVVPGALQSGATLHRPAEAAALHQWAFSLQAAKQLHGTVASRNGKRQSVSLGATPWGSAFTAFPPVAVSPSQAEAAVQTAQEQGTLSACSESMFALVAGLVQLRRKVQGGHWAQAATVARDLLQSDSSLSSVPQLARRRYVEIAEVGEQGGNAVEASAPDGMDELVLAAQAGTHGAEDELKSKLFAAVAVELQTVIDHAALEAATTALANAMKRNGVSGSTPGALNAGGISAAELQGALSALVECPGVLRGSSLALHGVGSLQVAVRRALSSGDWAETQRLLEGAGLYDCDSGAVHGNGDTSAASSEALSGVAAVALALPEAGAEVQCAIGHLNNWRVCSALSRALTTQRIAGLPGSMDASQCDGTDLQAALALAGALGAASARSRRLQTAAAALLELRNTAQQALEEAPACGSALHDGAAAGVHALPGCWAAVQAAVHTCQRCAKQEAVSDAVGDSPAAVPLEQPLQSLMGQEVSLVARDVSDRTSAMALWAALASPGPTGAIGALASTSVQTSRLSSALAAVAEHGVFTKATEALAGAVQGLLALRSAARGQDMAALRAALDGVAASQADGGPAGGAGLVGLPAVSTLVSSELQKYRDECDHARIMQLLQDAIEAGAARGSPAAAQLQGLGQGVNQLAAAIHESKDIGPKAPPAVALLAAAEHLLEVRQAAVDADWAALLQAVARGQDSPTGADASAPPSMAREVALLRGEARYQQLCAAVQRAVTSHAITGSAEEVSVADADTTALDAVSALADPRGVASRGLRQALDAAAALRRARAALVVGDLPAARDAVTISAGAAAAPQSGTPATGSGAASPSRHAAGAHDDSAVTLAAAVTAAMAEMALIQRYVKHTMALAAIAAALSSGAGVWRHATGDADPASVRTDSLRRAVAGASSSDTPAVVFAAALAKALLRVRRGQTDRDLGEIEAGLQDASAVPGVSASLSRGTNSSAHNPAPARVGVGAESAVRASIAGMFGRSDQLAPGMPDTLSVMDNLASRDVPSCSVQELSRARAQVVNSTVLGTIRRAVERGQATGRLGNLNLDSLDSQVLQAAEDDAVATLGLHDPSAAVDEALLTLRQLKSVREAVQAGSWGEVVQLVGDALSATGTPLLPGAVAEVRLLQSEALLRQAMASLGAALVADGLQGCVSEVSSGNASAQRLEAAMVAAETVPGQLPELSQLVAAARYMRRLRTALNSQDWSAAAGVATDVAAAALPTLAGDSVPQASQAVYGSAVAAAGVAMGAEEPLAADCCLAQAWAHHPLVRSGAVPLAGCAHLGAALFAAPEVWLARAEALWQTSASALQRASQNGAVTGMAGAVDVAGVSTGQLSTAVQGLADQWGRLLSACGVRGGHLWLAAGLPVPSHAEVNGDESAPATARNLPPRELLSMLESARYLVCLRKAVTDGKWAEIHAAALGREVPGLLAAPASLHGLAAAEVELICTEASIRATAAHLTEALRSGCARAWAHGAGSSDDAQPVTEGVLSSWDSDRGVDTSHVTTEQLEDAIAAAESIGLSTSASARLLATGRAMLAVRRAAASGDWQGVLASVTTGGGGSAAVGAVPVTSLHVFVQAEARLLLSHAANRSAAAALLPHFTAGAVQGSAGSLELAGVDATSLRAAVQKLAGVPLTASRPRLLMASAHQVATVRAALGGEGGADWHKLGGLMQDVARKQVAQEALQELQLVADSHRAHTLQATLRAACARGSGGGTADGAAGSPTHSTVLVHSSDLARAVKLVKDATAGVGSAPAAAAAPGAGWVSLTRPLPLPPALSRLLRFADALACARQAAAAEDWQAVARHLDSMQEQGLDSEALVAAAEIRNMRRTVADQACQRQLLAALQGGAIGGQLGDLDVTPVSRAPLQGAIAAAEQLSGPSARTTSLLATARAAVDMRAAVVEEDWEAVSASLPAVQAAPSGSLLADECRLLRQELDNRRAVAAMEHALGTGGVEGDIGALKLDKLQLAPLATAVADASDLQQKAPRTQGTLRVARLVLGVRRSLLANDWPRVRAALAPFRAALVASGGTSSAESSDAEDAPAAPGAGLHTAGTQGALAELRAVAPDMVQRLKDTLPPNDLAALALAPELVLVLRQIQDSAVAAQLSQALLTGAPRGSPTDLDLSNCDSDKLHAAVRLADAVGAKSSGTQTLSTLAVHVAGVRDALLCAEYARVPALVSAAVSSAGRHSGIPHSTGSPQAGAQGSGRSDPFAPLEAWVSNPMREGAAQFQLAHTPDGSLARSAEDGLVYTPVILTQSKLPDEVAPVVQRELRLAQAVAALSAVRSVAETCFDKGRPEGAPGALQLQHVSLDSLDRTQELISALPPEHTPVHLSVTLAAVKAVRAIRLGLLTDDWVAVEGGVEQAGEMGGDLPAAAAHDVELAVAVLHHRAVVDTGPLPSAIRSGGPPRDTATVGAIGTWTEQLQLNALDTGLAHAAAIGTASPAAQSLVRSAAFLRRVRAAAKAQEWELMESLLGTADDASLLQDVLPELDRYRLELAHSRAVAALVSGIESGHGMVTVASQWRQRSRSEMALLRATVSTSREASSGVSPTGDSQALVLSVQEQVEVEGGQRIDSGQVHVASLDAAIELADDVGMHSDSGAVLLRTAKVLRKLRSCVVHDDLPGLVAALEEARAGPLHSMAHEQLKAMLVEFDDRAVCSELVQALEQGRPTGSGGGAMGLSGVSVDPLDKAMAYAAAVGTRSHRAETLLLSARVIRTLRWELLHPGSDQNTLSAALAVADAQALAPEASTELHTVRNDILASMACVKLREALSFGSGVVTVRKALPRSPMPQSGAGDSDLVASPGSVQELTVDVAEVRIDVSNVQLAALDDAIAQGSAVGRHPAALTVLLSSAQAVRDVRAALLGGDWDEAAELARQYMDMPDGAVSGMSLASTGGWLGSATGQLPQGSEASRLAHTAQEELMGVQRALGLVHARGDAVHGLLSATSSADEGQLKAALRRAREVGLEGSQDPTARGAMVSARDKLIAVGRVKAQLSAAIASSHLPTLRAAVQSADETGYSGQEAQVAQETADAIQTLLQDSRSAMDELDDKRMMDVLRRADALGVSVPEAARMRQLLAMPAKDRLHLQLQAALKSGNVQRIAHTTMGIKRVFFAETSRSFSLSAYPGLRPFHEMADMAGVSTLDHSAHVDAASHLSHVLMHSNTVLKGSLSQLPANLQTGAVALSAYIAQYCGDQPREFAYPDTIAQELLQLALATPLLRDEVFIQLIRCMTGNHNTDSLQCARQLMFLCCSCFPPSEALENYLEAFLRRAREDACVFAVHKTAYSGAVPATPTISEIRETLLSLHQAQDQPSVYSSKAPAGVISATLSSAAPPGAMGIEYASASGSPYGRVQPVAPPTAASVSRSLRFDESGRDFPRDSRSFG